MVPQANSNPEMAGTTSSSATVESAAKRSPLIDLINILRVNRDKQLKTSHAKVFTSSKCIKACEEKEEWKHLAEENRKEKLKNS